MQIQFHSSKEVALEVKKLCFYTQCRYTDNNTELQSVFLSFAVHEDHAWDKTLYMSHFPYNVIVKQQTIIVLYMLYRYQC